jgi:hypothetical protein
MAGAPKGNQNARKDIDVEPIQIAISCDKELTQLLRQAFYSNQHPYRWPEDNKELAAWVRKYMRSTMEQFARESTDWELFETDDEDE